MVRPCIQALHVYVPGEQPKIPSLIKLNTNENPYPPSKKVFVSIHKALDSKLRLYPDPASERLRKKIASVYGFRLNQVIAGNGSDDILTMCLRVFVDEGQRVQFPRPTYSLYPVLTQIQNGIVREIPFRSDFTLDLKSFDPKAALTLVVHPNAPSGTSLHLLFLRRLAQRVKGVLVIDEAYADFAKTNALALARGSKNVLVTRSFSKSFSLAGIRLGFAVGHSRLIEALFKVKDSYNVDRLAQVAGEAALSDLSYHRQCVAKIIRTRTRFCCELQKRGWGSLPSEANFLLVKPPLYPSNQWLTKLRARKILVRWFPAVETRDYLRITIGTDEQMNRFLSVVDEIQNKVTDS